MLARQRCNANDVSSLLSLHVDYSAGSLCIAWFAIRPSQAVQRRASTWVLFVGASTQFRTALGSWSIYYVHGLVDRTAGTTDSDLCLLECGIKLKHRSIRRLSSVIGPHCCFFLVHVVRQQAAGQASFTPSVSCVNSRRLGQLCENAIHIPVMRNIFRIAASKRNTEAISERVSRSVGLSVSHVLEPATGQPTN
jgi:hypothetical protein